MKQLIDHAKFAARYLRMQFLRRMWKIVNPVAALAGPWAYAGYNRLRCPAWTPVRSARAFCHRFAWHRGDCLTDTNTLGENSPRGVRFRKPEKIYV